MTSPTHTTSTELSGADLEKIKQCAAKKTFKKDEIIFSEGDQADCLYFIESGELAVLIQKFTKQETVAVLEAGDCVGEMSFFNGERRSASVKAQTDGELLVVSRDAFIALLSQDEELESRIRKLVDARNRELAVKETLIDDHATGRSEKFQLGIKGDPSLRESAFMRTRYESVVDKILPLLQQSLYDLLVNRCVYEVLIHFNSGEVLVKSVFNPFVDDIHPATKLTSKAYINRHFALIDYNEKIRIVQRMMNHISSDDCMLNLDKISRGKLDMFYKTWNPLKPTEIAQTVSTLMSLRNSPDFYLRNFTISMIRDSIRLQFNCDGTHLLDGKAYQEFLQNNLIEDDGSYEIDRRKANRRIPHNQPTQYMTTFADRRSPPGRRQEDWEKLYETHNV